MRKIMKKRPRLNKSYFELSVYVIFTAVAIFVLTRFLDNSARIALGIGTFLHWAWNILVPLIIGFVLAYLLYPPVQLITKLLARLPLWKKKGKKPRGSAVLITYILAIAIVMLLLSVMISSITHEVSLVSMDGLTATIQSVTASLQSLYSDLHKGLNRLNISSADVKQMTDQITGWIGRYASQLGSNLLSSFSNITGIVSRTAIAIVLSVYFLLDTEGIEEYWDRVLKALAGQAVYARFHTMIRDADRVFSGYIRGQLLDALLMAILISASLSVINVKFAVIIGVLAGIGNLIPYAGPFIAYGLTILSCLLMQNTKALIAAVLVLLVIQTIDGNVIGPKIMSQNIDVHPMLIIVALLFGAAVGGLPGMLLAVPFATLLKIWFDRAVSAALQKREELKGHDPLEELLSDVEEAENTTADQKPQAGASDRKERTKASDRKEQIKASALKRKEQSKASVSERIDRSEAGDRQGQIKVSDHKQKQK